MKFAVFAYDRLNGSVQPIMVTNIKSHAHKTIKDCRKAHTEACKKYGVDEFITYYFEERDTTDAAKN